MNMKNVYKFGLCLLGALALNVSAQDFRGKDLNTSFRDKRIDNYQFQKARAVKGVTDFQRSAGDAPNIHCSFSTSPHCFFLFLFSCFPFANIRQRTLRASLSSRLAVLPAEKHHSVAEIR